MAEAADLCPHRVIYQVVYGSQAYGTVTEDSDTDIRGVFLPTVDKALGFHPPEDFLRDHGGADWVFFSLHKFCWLAMKGNPSVLEWLFVPDNCVLSI